MLTPMDIKQKNFHVGLGYDKKDVTGFFNEVQRDYAKLYKSNAELKEQVSVLSDKLQLYQSKEAELEKSLLLAEKDSEEKKSKATNEAKNIEIDARNKAKNILGDAEQRLEQIKLEMEELKTAYAAYKSNFVTMLKKQFEFMEETDFDTKSYIDDRAFALLAGGAAAAAANQPSAMDNSSFGTFNGDPQMRDPNMGLGGGGPNSAFGNVADKNSTSAVYTSGLAAGENFVDPFNPSKQNGRYNPFDGTPPVKKDKNAVSKFETKSDKKKK
ncbi:MAG: DivIVA domain-containing protein [Lachnospiraceae bacterium]|nr:DivIVA domain-containing protein [Lachnospiraceae bacterium]